MAYKDSLLSYQRPYEAGKYSGLGIFRDVPGRIFNPEIAAAPVKVVNNDEYALNQATLTLVTANTEYSVQGIPTLTSILIKARGGDVKLSIYEGQSGNNYTLIADGQSLEISTVPFGQISKPIALYAQSTTAGCVVEILGMRAY